MNAITQPFHAFTRLVRQLIRSAFSFLVQQWRATTRQSLGSAGNFYRPLPEGSIRLLCLLPGREGIIRCILREYRLNDAPAYEAISYCWGTLFSEQAVLLFDGDVDQNGTHGTKVQITVNLHEALSQFRLNNRPRIVWTDALCIDQSNLEERSHQVSSMAKIYRGAEQVLVWVGQAPDHVELIRQYIKVVGDILQNQSSDELKHVLRGPGFLAKHMGLEELPAVDERLRQAFERFMNRPYWTRAWIVELSEARRATIHAASQAFDWPSLGRAAFYVCHPYTKLFDTKKRGVSNASAVWQRKYDDENVPYVSSWGTSWEASDPRDIIYAFLNFRAVRKTLGAEPDYSASKVDIFMRFTKNHITQSGTLAMLNLIEHSVEANNGSLGSLPAHGHPSWLPNFERPRRTTVARIDLIAKACEGIEITVGLTENKSQMAIQQIMHGPLWKLNLRGIRFDSVTMMQSPLATPPNARNLVQSDMEGLASFFSYIRTSAKQTGPCCSPFDSLATTLTFGWQFDGSRVKYSSRTALEDRELDLRRMMLRRWFFRGADVQADTPQNCIDVKETSTFEIYTKQPHLIALSEPPEKMMGDLTQLEETFTHWILMANTNRRLFITLNGFVGLGPSQVLVGDTIAVLFGATHPFILRPFGDEWQIVGMFYAFGLLESCVASLEVGKVTISDFTIV